LKLFEIKSYINQLKWSDQGQVLHSQKFEDEPKFPPNITSVLELKLKERFSGTNFAVMLLILMKFLKVDPYT